jgi:trans-aconitate methyltransferase
MQRIPEPELMGDPQQASAYANADFSEPNERFVATFAAEFPAFNSGAVLDLGCGPGDIVLRLAGRFPNLAVHGLDGSPAMLAHGEAILAAQAELQGRVRFIAGVLPGARLPLSRYDAVVSNSLLHHLHDPSVLWNAVRAIGAPGAAVMVMDLYRPQSPAAARDIVAAYAAQEPEVLQKDFFNSLCAAFEPTEVRGQLDACGLGALAVRIVSDRHLLVSGRLPA